MKKIFICILACILGLATFKASSQTTPSQFVLQATTHGDIRNQLNGVISALYDTAYVQRLVWSARIGALNARILALENAPAAAGQVKIFGLPVQYQIPVFNGTDSTITTYTNFVFKNDYFGNGVLSPVVKYQQDAGTATANWHKFTAGTTTGQGVNDGFNIGIDGTGKATLMQLENLNMDLGVNNTVFLTITPTTFDIKTDISYPNVTPVGTYAYPYLSADHIQRWDSSYVLGSAVLNVDLMPLKDLLADVNRAGEIRWPMTQSDGSVKWVYRKLDMLMGEQQTADQGMIEASLRYTRQLEIELDNTNAKLQMEIKLRESVEKRLYQLEKDVAVLKHRTMKEKWDNLTGKSSN